MALARIKNWVEEELLFSDLNAEFNNLILNAISLISPLTGALDVDGQTITWDAAAVTTVVSSAAVSWNFTSGAKTGTPATTGSVANWSAQTFTDNATAGSGTAAAWTGVAYQRPTLAATNASVTTTDAATVYIANSPAAGTNQTITNPWALWVDAGNVRFDGNLTFTTGASVIVPGATSFAIRNNANSADNLLVSDAGIVTTRSNTTVTGVLTVTGICNINGANINVANTTAIPAGGAANTGVLVSSTASFGVYFGSGAPTVSAAQGSLYLRSDGSTTSTRAYINTNGSTTWTAITTAA